MDGDQFVLTALALPAALCLVFLVLGICVGALGVVYAIRRGHVVIHTEEK